MSGSVTNVYTINPSNAIALNYPSFTACGEMSSAWTTPGPQVTFAYSYIHPDYAVTSTAGSGSVSASNLLATLSTGSTTASSATLSSKNALKNYTGIGSEAVFGALFSIEVAGCTQIAGIGNSNDGYFFGYNPTTALFGVLARTTLGALSTSDVWYAQSSWNKYTCTGLAPFGFTLNQHNGNVYRIDFQGVGFGVVNFYVENPTTGQFILVHQVLMPNALGYLAQDCLPLFAFVSNGSTTGNVSVEIAAMAAMNQGNIQTAIGTRNASPIAIYTPTVGAAQTSLTSVLSLQNNTTYPNSGALVFSNQVRIYVDFLSLFVGPATSNGTAINLYLNPTTGSLTFSNVSANSVASTSSTNATVTNPPPYGIGTAGKLIFNTVLGSGQGGNQFVTINLKPYNIRLDPGDVLVVAQQAVTTTTSYTIYASLSWTELF